MARSTDIRLLESSAQTEALAYRTPMKFGGRVVTDVMLLTATVLVETLDGRRGVGHGSMPMGNVWAWPSAHLAPDRTLDAMVRLGKAFTHHAGRYQGTGHPLAIAHDLAAGLQAAADEVTAALRCNESMPRLAQMVAASPLDAAIHDAYGRALGQNSYNTLGTDYVGSDLSRYLSPEFAGETLEQYTLRRPKQTMPLYHLVGALDPLTARDVAQPVDDGLPETLAEWIVADGLTHLKIKLAGDDLQWDVARVLAVEAVAAEVQARRDCRHWHYSLDFNEKCKDVKYVVEFLNKINEQSSNAFARIQYIEQPTHRDLRAHPENRMHEAARIKPVVIDESLVDLESLMLCRELGYTGVALKACKGHSEALLMGAAAQKFRMFLCVQDLTCPGLSFLHSASLSARMPTVAAIEGNARQYCPEGNRGWADRYPSMFQVKNGKLGTEVLEEQGLGFNTDPQTFAF